MSKEEQEQRIGTEVLASHVLLKWVITLVVGELLVMIFGGFQVWFNDAEQDKKIVLQQSEIKTKQSKSEAKLVRELLEAKIGANSKQGEEIKQILFRMEDDIKAIRNERE